MRKISNARINFNTKLLKKLTKRDNSGVEVHTTIQHLAIYPHQLNNFSESVKGLLNSKIAKYNKTFNGILLGYQKIKLLRDEGTIHDDSCFIHFDIQTDFYVFKPEIGKIMNGMVNRKSKDHIGALVYEAFNVSIPLNIEEGDNLGDSIKIGDKVTFQISYINLASFLPYIRGKLISEILEEDESIATVSKVKKKKKKSKIKEEPIEVEEFEEA